MKKDKKAGLIWLVPLILIGLIGVYKYTEPAESKPKPTKKTAPKTYTVGRVDACAKNPSFPSKEGMKPPYLIDLRQIQKPGLQIIEARKGGKILAKKEWGSAGTLGPHTLDKNGVIYTAPIPFVSLKERPPSFYNRLLAVDANTGAMNVFMHVPNAKTPTEANPYGIVGLTYDCSNHSIYIASLGGSDGEHEVGRIFHVDLKTKTILHQLEGFDALGIGLFTMRSGKKLYLGSARTPEIFSISLDEKGGFVGQPKFEFSLAAVEGGSFDKAHRIRFLNGNRLKIKGIEFSYSLMAASEPQRNIYLFDYDSKEDKWNFNEVHPQ